MRFATLAERALSRVASYLAPDPLHARRRAHIPVVSSPIGFSRLGIALPVVAQFGANGTGSPGGPPNPQPRVCVLAANPDGTFPNTSSPLGVPAVQVEFTATSGAVSPAIDETGSDGCVSANWTLADFVGQQSLVAKVGAPDRLAGVPAVIDGVTNAFPNNEHSTVCDAGTLGCYWWAAHTFTATAATAADPFDVFFLSPLGESTTGQNVTSPEPTVRVCGPLQTNPGACSGLPRPTLRQGAWETSWRTSRTDAVGSRYRIEVLMNNMVTGRFYATSGGGGGGTTDPLGSENNPYQFQRGNTIPVRFKVIAP
jgi:hypothetical protein